MTTLFRRAAWGIIGGLLFMLSLIWLNRTSLLGAIGDFLVVSDAPQPADLIHVLGGNHRRGEYAAELYHQGYADKLFFTGQSLNMDRVPKLKRTTYGQALSHDVDLKNIILPDVTATSTYEEALALKQLLHDKPTIKSVIIVSDGYHMRRVCWTFSHVIGDRARLFFVPIPAAMSPVIPRWWQKRQSRKILSQEYAKLLYYELVYLW
ncbi:MAG TPA: YdcF family protein [Anaerolineae bacterium]|nr:YdcF family protein [Anaerolineae bacterium]